MNDLNFFYEYISEFQERDVPKEELNSQYVRYWMIESIQEDVWKSNCGYITESDYVYVDELKNIEPKETVYPSKITHDEIMNCFNMKSWQIGNYEAGKSLSQFLN